MQKTFSLTTAMALTLGFLGGIGSESLQASQKPVKDFNIEGGLLGLGNDLLLNIIQEMHPLKDMQNFLAINKRTKSLINHEYFPVVLRNNLIEVEHFPDLLAQARKDGYEEKIDYETDWENIIKRIGDFWLNDLKDEVIAMWELNRKPYDSFKLFFYIYLKQELNDQQISGSKLKPNFCLNLFNELRNLDELIEAEEKAGYGDALISLGLSDLRRKNQLIAPIQEELSRSTDKNQKETLQSRIRNLEQYEKEAR